MPVYFVSVMGVCASVSRLASQHTRCVLWVGGSQEFEEQKLQAWGSWAQDPVDGHVYECVLLHYI